MGLGLLPDEAYQLIVAGALLSITMNPVLFAAIARNHRKSTERAPVRLQFVRPVQEATAGSL